ncbi:hypothetical protein ACQ4PT_048969 [Festuca glaucescens]
MASHDVVGAASACQSGQAALAAGLLKRFTAATATAGGNLVFSPLSIHVVLALMSAAPAPVEARKQINVWVAKVTRNLISEVVNPQAQSKETLKVVANAIYFKGEWRQPFDKEHTVDHRKFHLLDGSPVKAFFMRRLRLHEVQIACHDGSKVLKLPYKVHWKQLASLPKFSMCVLLPDARDGLPSLLSRMTSRPEFLHEHLPTSLVPVGDFRLPRFKLTFRSSIVHVLKSLGLRLPFEPDTMDLTEKMEGAQLYVDDVIHKAVIEVNEAGSEAAAYTESDDDMSFSLFGDEPPPPKPVDFVADHPFAFFIIEETTGTIVFSGHVLDPLKKE